LKGGFFGFKTAKMEEKRQNALEMGKKAPQTPKKEIEAKSGRTVGLPKQASYQGYFRDIN